MIRVQQKIEAERRPLREVLGMPESSGSAWGSTFYKAQTTCFRAARLRQLGVRKIGAKTDGLDFGDAFHLVLEAYYRGRQAGLDWRAAVANAWKVLDPIRDEPGYGEIRDALEVSLTSYFEFAMHDRWSVVAVEEELTYQGLSFDYSARLDLVVIDEEDGGMWIVEHKSAKVITADMTQGYLLDLQTLGQIWLLRKCVDLSQYPEFKGVIVNITSKQKTPKHERVRVRATDAHLHELEKSLVARKLLNEYAAELGYPKMLGNCSGAAQYFKSCAYFDICHGRPDFDIAGVDKLLPHDLPYGFTISDTAEMEPTD